MRRLVECLLLNTIIGPVLTKRLVNFPGQILKIVFICTIYTHVRLCFFLDLLKLTKLLKFVHRTVTGKVVDPIEVDVVLFQN